MRFSVHGLYENEIRPMILYLIREGRSNYFKVGIAKQPRWRCCGLQGGNPRELKIIKTWEFHSSAEAHMAEQIILNKHKKFYVRGEWLFIKKKSIIDFIDELYAIIARKEKLPVDGGDAVCRQIEDYNNKVAA